MGEAYAPLLARVRVRMDDFEDGALPMVCASSGQPADRLYTSHVQYSPLWPFLFLVLFPFGILVTVVLCFVLSRRADGFLPYADAVHRRMRRSRTAGWIAAAVGCLMTALGGFGLAGRAIESAFTLLLLVGVVTIIAGLTRAAYPSGSIGGKPDANGRWITLRSLSTEFVVAYEAQERRRRAERRYEVTSRA
jgi:hypothetical protein